MIRKLLLKIIEKIRKGLIDDDINLDYEIWRKKQDWGKK